MNKKFLTALLLGAFTIASTSTLVSCKDYDDDINGLQEQIDGNGQDIAALQSALNKAKTDLQADITKLEGELAAEKARAEAAEKKLTDDLTNAKNEINSSIASEIARAKAEEGKLNTLISDEVTRATAAEAAIEAKIKTANEAIDAIEKALATKADKATFEAFVAEANAKMKTLGEDLATAQANLQKAIDAEKDRAQKAEEAILGKLSDEQKAREAADKAEKEAREAAVAALEAQDKALQAFDEKIQTRVDNIEKAYKAADEQLGKDIAAAKSDLEAKIAAAKAEVLGKLAEQEEELKTLIASEKKELEGKITALDTKLTQALKDEKDAREAADKKEAADRVKAIQDLQDKLDAHVVTLQNMIQNLSTKLTNEVTRLEGLISAAQTAAENAQADATAAGRAAQKAQDDLADEISRAKQAEQTLTNKLASEEIARLELRNEMLEEIGKEADARTNAIQAAVQPLTVAVNNVSDRLNVLANMFSNQLRSLVAEPQLYYHGIQAFEASKFEYYKLTVDAAGLNDKADADWYNDKVKTTSTSLTTFIPDLTATYHLNPSNADINEDASLYKFVVLNEKYTRELGGNKVKPIIYKATKGKGNDKGKVTVKARVADAQYIKDIASQEAVTVLAMQYSAGDTVITSDYAALTANTYRNLVLNNVHEQFAARQADNPHSTHLWLTAKQAVDEAYDAANTKVVKIAWDSKGINLYDIVNTHRDYISGTSSQIDVAWDSKASDNMLKNNYGLVYSFQLIGYKKGSEKTSESAHAWIYETEDGKLMFVPQKPGEDGKARHLANYDSDNVSEYQNRSEIGREPLVRVLLTNTKNTESTSDDDIVAVGYIKFYIDKTPDTPNPEQYKEYSYSWDDAYTVVCNPTNVFSGTKEWNVIEHDILSDLKISSTEFREFYDPYVTGTPEQFFQYDYKQNPTTKDYEYVLRTNMADYTGVVTEVKSDIQQGMTTDKFKWDVDNATAWAKLKKVGDKIEVYVMYNKKGGFPATSPVVAQLSEDAFAKAPAHVVFHFTWAPKAVNRDPKTSFNKDIIAQYWYGAHATNPGNGGNDNIHGNVEAVGNLVNDPAKLHFGQTPEADDEFIFDIKSTLNGNKNGVNTIDGYPALDAAKSVTIDFVEIKDGEEHANIVTDVNNKKYTLKGVREGNVSWLVATPTDGSHNAGYKIAQMYWDVTNNPEAGVISFGNAADPVAHKVAQDLLNYAGRMEQGQTVKDENGNEVKQRETLTAKVEVKVNTCAPQNSVPVSNSTFYVKFIRPISATPAKGTELVDAVTGGSLAPVKMEFVDWRNHKFTDKNVTANYDYYDYYGVSDDVANLVLPTLGTGTDAEGKTYYILDPAKIQTTLGKGGTLKSISSDLALSWYPPTKIGTPANVNYRNKPLKDEGFGILVYDNNGANVGEFEITVPVDVKYDWGTIKTSFKATVHETTWAPVKRK